jgi:hypothetical protein
MQVALTLIFGATALLMASVYLSMPARRGPLLGIAVFNGALAIIAYGVFQVQFRAVRKATERVRASMGAIAGKLFDAPVPVLDRYDGSELIGPWGGMSRGLDGDTWSAAEGDWKGARLLVASHPSVVGRQMFEMYHVYSYVVVDVPGVKQPFTVTEEAGAFGNLFTGASNAPKVEFEDPAFEKAWLVHSEPGFAKRVLDGSVRLRLLELREQVKNVSQDFAQGRMSLRLDSRGLIVRWPGELNAHFAGFMRDLLMDLRGKMLG